MDYCKIHKDQALQCLGGRSAHPSNWYCVICDKEKELSQKQIDANRCEKIRKEFENHCKIPPNCKYKQEDDIYTTNDLDELASSFILNEYYKIWKTAAKVYKK